MLKGLTKYYGFARSVRKPVADNTYKELVEKMARIYVEGNPLRVIASSEAEAHSPYWKCIISLKYSSPVIGSST